jgi:hypothetical protein
MKTLVTNLQVVSLFIIMIDSKSNFTRNKIFLSDWELQLFIPYMHHFR